ncbi:hypothetical protein P167DRAFT_136295 [Morchella conica CCBAS932]|uniref:Uncharacterized protein n=1 Tax=Morchella conica CCBAS932 TaxID=1392247 RepID=A0A3N4KUS1_9PEZI|nr:hypothetical protein P167DRAFT_136295 [Morchella conica CCBAS932]
MVLAFSSVFPDRVPSGRFSGLLSQPFLMRGLLIWRAFTAIDHRRSDNNMELPQPGASWHHQFIASTNDIAADILTNPIAWLCDTVLLVSLSYFVLFLLNSLISLLLSLSCPSLPHLEKQQIQIQVHKTFSLPLVSAATWNTGPLQAVIFFVLFFLVAQKQLSVHHRPGETSSIRSVLSTFMIPLLSLIIMGGFIVVGISAWGLLAGRWFQQFRPVRRLGQWLEMRSAAGGQDLERGWESGLISRGPTRKAIEEPEVLGFSGVMIVVDQKPVAPPAPKPSAIELAPAAPRHIPVEKTVIMGPTAEEIEELRAGCRRIEDIRSRIQGRMVEMKVEIERIGGGGDRYRPVPRNRKKG